ncbi:Shy8 [Streptomyces lincolnensis]|uniref:Shy8 n=1 Tax=Streptomyces lincolnensis TaxID=1915 RepID=A0A1B1M2X7_STRLN|nr:adenylyl-sulfate kinase [Streptomyces lincolnensis]ANS62824.1 Shy8 [Streptomyces lincolnensis]AXG51748.1 Shy8 [Streptomyces lincolnensis]QMV04765.1 adenylyl-sulfate kinase [Streptomyces lincolnensis]
MLTVLGGLPATGKTTLARLLADRTGAVHLRQGLSVVAESVNPLAVTRDAWRDAAVRAGVPYVEVEVVCSDPVEHRRRVGARSVDIPDLPLPGWEQNVEREYERWHRERAVVDTAGRSVEESLGSLPRVLG